jgi:hypothetical protein
MSKVPNDIKKAFRASGCKPKQGARGRMTYVATPPSPAERRKELACKNRVTYVDARALDDVRAQARQLDKVHIEAGAYSMCWCKAASWGIPVTKVGNEWKHGKGHIQVMGAWGDTSPALLVEVLDDDGYIVLYNEHMLQFSKHGIYLVAPPRNDMQYEDGYDKNTVRSLATAKKKIQYV